MDLERLSRMLRGLPEPLAYIVLDHNVRTSVPVEERDGHGRKFVRVSPSLLDAVTRPNAAPLGGGISLYGGIPVYRRDSMPEGWPY